MGHAPLKGRQATAFRTLERWVKETRRVDFTRTETALPAFLTILLVPLTFSIAHGIGYGLLAYVAIAVCRGRARHVHPIMYGVALAFGVYFLWE